MSRAVCCVAKEDLPTVSMQPLLPPMARRVAGRKKKSRRRRKKKGGPSTHWWVQRLKASGHNKSLPAWETAHQVVTSEWLICKRIHIYGDAAKPAWSTVILRLQHKESQGKGLLPGHGGFIRNAALGVFEPSNSEEGIRSLAKRPWITASEKKKKKKGECVWN